MSLPFNHLPYFSIRELWLISRHSLMIFIVICIQNAVIFLPLGHNFFSQLRFNFWVDHMGWHIGFHRRTGTYQVLITMSIIYATYAWPQFGVSLNKGLKKKKCNLYIATIICQFDELRLSLTWLDLIYVY